MQVAWNLEALGFQECWLWQFGTGPFEFLSLEPIPTVPLLLGRDQDNQEVWITYQPGWWVIIATPNSTWAKEYGLVLQTRMHSQYLLRVIDGKTYRFDEPIL